MKGQMFIVTMVFMVGLVFAVQTLLFNYVYLDVSTPLEDNDFLVISDTDGMIAHTVSHSTSPDELEASLSYLAEYMRDQIIPRYTVNISYSVDPSRWSAASGDPLVDAEITVRGPESQSTAFRHYYRPG